jgi:protocatechuate 3,4-dioxygenase beta subunit
MCVLGIVLAVLLAQAPQGSIEGVVTKLGTGEPIAGATVQLNRERDRSIIQSLPAMVQQDPAIAFSFHRTLTTGQDGKFAFENVVPGTYRLVATRSGGYVPGEYGQRSPTGIGIPFDLTSGQKMTGIRLTLTPSGTISGRVYDRDGAPVGRAQVQALKSVYENGRRKLTIVQSVETNDRGEYRLFWLAPGQYFVSAKPDNPQVFTGQGADRTVVTATRITEPARIGGHEQTSAPIVRKRRSITGEVIEEVYVPVYYPGTTESQRAAPIAVAAGGTVSGVDLSVGAGGLRARHIRGVVINSADGQPLAGASVTVIPRTASPDPNRVVPRATSEPNGMFDIAGVVPGSYVLVASNPRLSGFIPVDVGSADLQNVAIVAMPGVKLAGRFMIEGRSRNGIEPNVTLLRVDQLVRDPQISGIPSGGPSFNPPPSPDGSFVLEGIGQGNFRVGIRALPPEAYIKSMRMGSMDVLSEGLNISGVPENPLEIVIGVNAAGIAGSVVNARQEPVANRTVALIPDPPLRHRTDLYKTMATDSSGRFRMQGLSPGDYKLFAWENVETGAWMDPDFVRVHENRGRPVRLTEAADENVQLTVIP